MPTSDKADAVGGDVSDVGVPLAVGLRPGDSLAEAEISAWVAKAQHRALESIGALSAFQRRMERFPQLSAEAQLELVAEYQDAERARAEIEEVIATTRGRSKAAAARRQRQLRDQVARGRRAEEYLIGSNFRLLQLICRENAEERFGRERAYDVLSDLVAEASVALVEAIRTYDHARCPVFSTYAARVMRDRVRFVLSKEGAMRLPPSWNRLKRIASVRIPQLEADLGRHPTADEIRADLLERCMEWAADKLTDSQRELPEAEQRQLMVAKLRKQGMLGAINSLSEVLQASQTVASLDANVGDDGSSTLGDMISGPVGNEMLDTVDLGELRETLAEALSVLPDRERQILLLRFGFVDGERWTYAAIGEQFSVTAERIRQIERNVLNKLAGANSVRDRLAAFLPSLDGEELEGRDNGRRAS